MEKYKYILGLDVGISSVGWGMLALDEENNPTRIIDTGVRIFTPGEHVKTGESKTKARTAKRGTRRITRRREFRVDRIRYLLFQNNFLGKYDLNDLHVHEVNEILSDVFSDLITEYYKNKDVTPYDLKVKALDEKISSEELAIILVHYAKHRGYKSNREDNTSTSAESGKVKKAIAENNALMIEKGYRTISEMILNDERFSEKKRNSSGDYKTCVTREQYLEEIEKVLDAQIRFGLISNEFKSEYINIWVSQRHYASGPGGNSKYGGDLIAKMVGTCKFDGNPRAPKFAPSTEIFVALSKLVNLRYRIVGTSNYQVLTKEQINDILEMAKSQDKISFRKIVQLIGEENIEFKGLSLGKDKYISVLKKFKKEVLNLADDDRSRVDIKNLNEAEKEAYDILLHGALYEQIAIELKGITIIRKEIKKQFGSEEWNLLLNHIELLDLFVEIVTNYKTDDDVIKHLKEFNVDEKYYSFVLSLPNFKDHNNLSLDLIRKLNPLLLDGKRYDEAMNELVPDFRNALIEEEKYDLLIPINKNMEIRNQRVIRSLSQTRKVLNAIIKRYGMPHQINIETARELSKTMQERNKISRQMEENKLRNEELKKELVKTLSSRFKTIEDIKSMDLLKYKLWIEQQERCTYSLEKITIEELYDNNLVQIDHILPYSRTFNDNYLNKTLVKSKFNQEKANKTPYEWFGKTEKWDNYVVFIDSLDIPNQKKDNYLLKGLTLEIENEMRNQNLNDTKYISKYLTNYLKAYLNVPKVFNVSGSITGKLRGIWGLNRVTHSLESRDYYYSEDDHDEKKKNRENHLHHAMDSLVIASVTPSLVKQITSYEKYKRYINGKTLNQILNAEEYLIEEKNDQYVDHNTGEVFEDSKSLREYFEKMKMSEYIEKKKNSTYCLHFPLPYAEFIDELKIRVFEQDQDVYIDKINRFPYLVKEKRKMYPIIPSISKPKVGGSLHGETYYGIKIRENEKVVHERMSVISSSFNDKKLELIVDKEGGSKVVYETLISWLDGQDGEKAFKEKGYPKNPLTDNLIKKIKLETPFDGKGHIIGTKLVAKENVVQVKVFKKVNEDKMYFIGLDSYDVIQLKKGHDVDVIVWWGQGKNNVLIKYSELVRDYNSYIELQKNDLIEVELYNGAKGAAYSLGFTSGIFEVGSKLGDGLDLIGENLLFNKSRERYQLTISTIKSIEKLNISVLGKIDN